MIAFLNGTIAGRELIDIDHFYFQILENYPDCLDSSLIRACRELLSNFMIDNADYELRSGLTISQSILPSYKDQGIGDMNSYCAQYVKPMGVDSEGVFVEAGLLPSLLGVSCNSIFIPDRNFASRDSYEIGIKSSGQQLAIYFSNPFGDYPKTDHDNDSLFCLHIYLRPGHYNLLYLGNSYVFE